MKGRKALECYSKKQPTALGGTCRHCEEQSDEAIHWAAKQGWIASLRSQ
jgi:hypothetical protein